MNKKGFTLIELLAVIVILAVIALIATPIILGVIDKAKQGSAEQSANGYINAIENQVVVSQLKNENVIVDGVHSVEELDKLAVEVKGKKPDKGNVVIEKGIVTNYTLGIGEYVVTDGLTEKVTNTKKYENGTAVYYNPVTGEKCESSDAISTPGTKI